MTATQELLDCGHAPSEHSEHTTGYGIDATGRKHCYDCCHTQDLRALASADKWVGYVSLNKPWDGCGIDPVDYVRGHITNWPGRSLMTITRTAPKRSNWWYVGKLLQVWAIDEQGRFWYGVGSGDGMCIRLRKIKAGAK